MPILLWIGQGGISICNLQVTTVPPEGFAIKLKAVVQDKGIRDLEPSDNIFLNKSLGVHVPDICQWFSFNPFGEIIRVNYQISLIPCCFKEMTYNVQTPLRKWLRVGQRIKDPSPPGLVNV